MRLVLTAMFAAALLMQAATDATACACCSNRGSRTDAPFKIDGALRAQLEQIKFSPDATLMTTEADTPAPLAEGASDRYTLEVTRTATQIALAFRDSKGRDSTVRFAMPRRMWVFAVDPFGDAKDDGLGPALYKEWRLGDRATSSGVFRRVTGPAPKATLILHGRGRGCTDATEFSDWSLRLDGPKGKLTLFGALAPP